MKDDNKAHAQAMHFEHVDLEVGIDATLGTGGDATKWPIRLFDYATVYNVVDGDTLDIAVDLGYSVTIRHRFRMARINAPELHNADGTSNPDGVRSGAWLRRHALGKPCRITVAKLDKYGRYLCELEVDGANLNDAMLRLKLAQPWNGEGPKP
jgi:endonuclease YncB( thermonuclease family)